VPTVCLGIITRPVGIRGAVRIHPYTSSPSAFLDYRNFLRLDLRPLTCLSARVDGRGEIISQFAEFPTRDSVESLRMRRLFVPRDKLPPLQDDEYYLRDLEGLLVISALDGRLIGHVVAAQDYGAGVFLEISLSGSRLISTLPFHKESVLSVDLISKQIVVVERFLI
jgi:16S rRNA processing protein RimM